jgi:hypothetical protein
MSESRFADMTSAYSGLTEENKAKMMDLLEERLTASTGPSCELPKRYEPPTEDLESREA